MAATFCTIKSMPVRMAFALVVAILLASCGAGQRITPLELSDSRPSLLFFTIEH